jgi:MYXO-CTERM domain-containing protein
MQLDSASGNPCVEAPAWTAMEGGDLSGVEMNVRHDGLGSGELWVLWAAEGQDFDADHRQIVTIPSDALGPVILTVPFRSNATVTGLRILATSDTGVYEFDSIRSGTASDEVPDPPDADVGSDGEDAGDAGDVGGSPFADGGADQADAGFGGDGSITGEACGCSTPARPAPTAGWLALLIGGLSLGARRRRR